MYAPIKAQIKELELLDNVKVVFCDLPGSIGGYTVCKEDFYTIVLNSRLSRYKNIESYQHEVDHILNGDFEKRCSVDLIEFFAHN